MTKKIVAWVVRRCEYMSIIYDLCHIHMQSKAINPRGRGWARLSAHIIMRRVTHVTQRMLTVPALTHSLYTLYNCLHSCEECVMCSKTVCVGSVGVGGGEHGSTSECLHL